METKSVNGKLEPLSSIDLAQEPYTGHFLKVLYTREIDNHPVFSKDRVDVGGDGSFRFFIPPKELLINEMVTIEIYAPDGSLIDLQSYSYGSLKASDVGLEQPDDSQPMIIQVDPVLVDLNDSGPVEEAERKISGKVIDLTGERETCGLQVILMVTDDAGMDFDPAQYRPVLSAITDRNGYFFGRVENNRFARAFGVIAGGEDNAIEIRLEDGRIPKNVLLVGDLSTLPEREDSCEDSPPGLPDADDLVNSSAYSQDIGGKCVDFTIPNRTLEEFSFYQTVRTTEPEIRGLTITTSDTREIGMQVEDISNIAFPILDRLNGSFNSLSLNTFTVEKLSSPVDTLPASEQRPVAKAQTTYKPTKTNYMFSLDIGQNQQFDFTSSDLLKSDPGLLYLDIVRLAAEQLGKKRKLKELQEKLAAAYCGIRGVEPAKTFCEKILDRDQLNRNEIRANLGHLMKNKDSLDGLSPELSRRYDQTLFKLEMMVNRETVSKKDLVATEKELEKLIEAIDKGTTESRQQENILYYLRRIIIELARAEEGSAPPFEPCPPDDKMQTMGIVCLIRKFKEIREMLKNTTILSLGEIVEIQDYYEIFLHSLSSFLPLLDEFYRFYTSSGGFATELVDDYFVQEHDQIKSTLTRLKIQIQSALKRLDAIKKAYIRNHPGRTNLSVENSVDWDETPTIYENTTIAHGHILHFKQKWKADGYSLGDLLYSLPLAPCQEKQIAILDWDRKERGDRREDSSFDEQLEAELSHERDISEIIASSLTESMRASSSNKTSSTSAGIGAGVGGFISGILFGVAGGVAHSGASSRSSASQNSARNLSANALSSLREQISQSASSVRNQRSTVIQTVSQAETVNAQTEVIKNNNHCHAMTVEYFEVLRHYAVEQELVDVQECLFVPMPMSLFDNKKVLRWKNTLQRSVYGRKLRRGFDAIERIEDDYAHSDFPDGVYAEEMIEEFTGHFTITFELKRPYIKEIDEATKTEEYDLSLAFPWFFGRMVFHLEQEVPLTEAEKDAIFEEEYAPDIARSFVDTLRILAVSDEGNEEDLNLDLTLLSSYRRGAPLRVGIASGSLPSITRIRIKHLRFRAITEVTASSKIILRSAYLHYRTAHLSEYIIRNQRIDNDIINVASASGFGTVTDAALIYTPLNQRELSNPKKEDEEAARALLDFLNEHLEMSHKVLWSSLDSSRLFGLLDGYIAPNAGGKSVASVVENKVSGIVGNNLVLKVIPGERLDPVFRNVEDLLGYYQPTTKPDPFRLSVPTKGVYAEAVMGRCNSCEIIDESRHWRFTEQPCGTQPTAIETLSTSSRRSESGDLQASEFPSSIINMQNAPAAPDPTGLSAAFGLLGKGDAFRDITGLSGTQKNALEALKTTSASVTDLASISKDFANLAVMANAKKDGAKQIEQVKKLNKDGYLNDEESKEQIKKILDAYPSAAQTVSKGKEESGGSVARKIAEKIVSSGLNSPEQDVEYTKVNAGGESETIKVSSPVSSQEDVAPRVFLSGETSSSDARAFHPAEGDKSLVIELSATVSNAPADAHVKWLADDPTALIIDNPDATHTRVRGVKPGPQKVWLQLVDTGGNVIENLAINLSVPQCVVIEEDTVAFETFLEDINMPNKKDDIIAEMRKVAEHLLRKTNTRLYWKLVGLNEDVPAHVPEKYIVTASIHDKDPANTGLLGETHEASDPEGFNETIDLYPGAYAMPDAIDVDTETQAIILQLETDLPGNSALEPIATQIFGRLIGETLSHEVGHALLWLDIPTGHNQPPIDNDIMNRGVERMFRQRTGMENTVMESPVEPDHYIDHGLDAIGGFQALNQSRLDRRVPVPPAFA